MKDYEISYRKKLKRPDLSGVGHEALAPEGGLLEEPGQGARMVQMEVGDQQQVDLHDQGGYKEMSSTVSLLINSAPRIGALMRGGGGGGGGHRK